MPDQITRHGLQMVGQTVWQTGRDLLCLTQSIADCSHVPRARSIECKTGKGAVNVMHTAEPIAD